MLNIPVIFNSIINSKLIITVPNETLWLEMIKENVKLSIISFQLEESFNRYNFDRNSQRYLPSFTNFNYSKNSTIL